MSDLLSFSRTGKGPAVVLLHGFCENRQLWNELSNYLAKDYDVIYPDLPGHGASKTIADVTIDKMAEKVHELLFSLNIDNAVFIGHSMGGYVTLAIAKLFPHLINAIGLFHSTAFADTEEKKINRNRTIDFVEKNGSEKFADNFVAPLFYVKNRTRLAADIEKMILSTKNTTVDGIIAATKAMRDREDASEVLKNLTVPVLFIAGKEDNAVPIQKTFEQAVFPKEAIVQILEETGHMGMFERKAETQTMVKAFLNKTYGFKQ